MTVARIAVSTTLDTPLPAKELALHLHLDFIDHPLHGLANDYDYLLLLTPQFLGLQKMGEKLNPFYIDFSSGKLFYRSQRAGLRNELLARAMGFKPVQSPRILDATAGLGRDSFILSTLGFEVWMTERSPTLWALLTDALKRAKDHALLLPVIERLHLMHADASEVLRKGERFDVIYMDPMFPERKKSASVKKEMAILQDLLGKDDNSTELFELALTCTQQRVVIKRPRLAAYLTGLKPNFSLTGKSSRFDVYLKPQ